MRDISEIPKVEKLSVYLVSSKQGVQKDKGYYKLGWMGFVDGEAIGANMEIPFMQIKEIISLAERALTKDPERLK